jgi:hypothetical protein
MNLHPLLFTSSPLLRLSFVLLTATCPLISADQPYQSPGSPVIDEMQKNIELVFLKNLYRKETVLPPRRRLFSEEYGTNPPDNRTSKSIRFEWTPKKIKGPEVPFFYGGKLQSSFSLQIKGDVWGWKAQNPPRSFVSGAIAGSLECKTEITWGPLVNKTLIAETYGDGIYNKYYLKAECTAAISARLDCEISAFLSESCIHDLSTRLMSISAVPSVQLQAKGKVGLKITHEFIDFWGRPIIEATYLSFGGEISGTLQVSAAVYARYRNETIPKPRPNYFGVESVTLGFNGVRCDLIGQMSYEWGNQRIKIGPRLRYKLYSNDALEKFIPLSSFGSSS